MTTVRIPISIRTELTPNRSFRTPRNMIYRLQREAKEATVRACEDQVSIIRGIQFKREEGWPLTLHVTVARGKRKQALDDDNMVAGLKYVVDGIAKAIGVNDKHMHIARPVNQIRDPDGVGYIEVTIQATGELE